ncbi:hypothetical protein ScPMuIL_014318 [Solemya velum]
MFENILDLIMTDLFCHYFLDTAKDLFFSGNVQTTTIAVAVAASLCCSILSAVIHFVRRKHPDNTDLDDTSVFSCNLQGLAACADEENDNTLATKPRQRRKDRHSFPEYIETEVPCVRYGVNVTTQKNIAGKACLFVTFHVCCFDKSVCPLHFEETLELRNGIKKQKETEINLSYYGISKCPDRLCFAGHQLTLLNLSNNSLRHLPPEFSCLRGLQELLLKNNFFKTIPESVISLKSLKLLNLRGNCLQTLPDSVGSLFELQYLDLSLNKLTSLPEAIGQLAHLEILVIQSNQLKTLPGSMAKLMCLQVLDISTNLFSQLPGTICQLFRLRQLSAISCQLTSLPKSLSQCSNLQVLTLSKNRLKALPGQLSHLHKLCELDVCSNKLNYLPATLLESNIQVFSISGNPFLTQESDLNEKIVKTTEDNFPSLLELTARFIVKEKIGNTVALPVMLQDMLGRPDCCTRCGDPVFTYFLSNMTVKVVGQHSIPCPFYSQLCSPHLKKQCRLMP